MRRLGIYILGLVLLLLATSFLWFFLNEDKLETVSPSDYVRVDSFRFCGIAPFSAEKLQQVSICGLVVAADKQSIPIRMYLYEMPGKILVDENPVNDRFSTGEFVRQFELPDGNSNGSYKIVAYFYKQVVGELEFEIRGP